MSTHQEEIRSLVFGKCTWLDLRSPSAESLRKIQEDHGFHILDIEDCLTENQRSKIDEYEKYLFLIVHLPHYDKRRQHVTGEEVDIFIKNNLLITIHDGNLKSLNELFENLGDDEEMRKEVLGKGSGYLLYEVMNHMFNSVFPLLENLQKKVNGLERDVFSLNTQKDMLQDILNTKKNIITFRRVISPQRSVIAEIENKNKKFLPDSLEIYFGDVVDKVEKIWAVLENLKELIGSVQETNESILSHATNNVIKTLTIFSVIMLPLTFLTGLYGMNVDLPFSGGADFFYILAGTMLALVSSMLLFFKWMRWL